MNNLDLVVWLFVYYSTVDFEGIMICYNFDWYGSRGINGHEAAARKRSPPMVRFPDPKQYLLLKQFEE